MSWIIACGIYNLCFGLFHLAFWRLLHWRDQLPRLSETNQAVVQALNLCLTFFFFLVAYIYLQHGDELRTTGIGKTAAVGMLLFWLFRTGQQLTLFDLKKRVHQLLLGIFCLGIFMHGAVLLA